MTARKTRNTERGRFLRRLLRWMATAFVVGAVAAFVFYIVWEPRPETEERFDRQLNGVWVGHKWYTGVSVRGEEPVTDLELEALAATIARHGLRYVYVHVGPVLSDGTIADEPGPLLGRLLEDDSGAACLAWLGGLTGTIDLADPLWRAGFLETCEGMVALGFDGIHLNFEPLHNHHDGYIELLAALRAQLGPDVLISHATHRSAPLGLSLVFLDRHFWSGSFYRRAMAHADQTVLMGYDTGLGTTESYLAFIGHQTRLLVRWASAFPGHQVLIGIPSYEEGGPASDPLVENIANGALAVRRGLEREGTGNGAFAGVAVYANWVTDEQDWADFRRYWMEGSE